jgi:putative ABC transport system permease protein
MGMGVGIGAILFLVSLGYGLQKTLLEKITTSDSLLTLDVAESKSVAVSLDSNAVDEIQKLDGVAEVSKSFSLSSQGQMNNLSADLISVGIDPTFLRLGGIKVSKGETLNDEKIDNVIITSSVAQIFGSDEDSVLGQEINISFFMPSAQPEEAETGLQEKVQDFGSSKVYKIGGVIEGEESMVYINYKSLENIQVQKYDRVKIKCVSNSEMNNIRDKIMEKGFIVSSLSDTVDQANQVFSIIQIILMCFGIVALVVSAIGMFNTMTIALLERTNEIGIMKSIGASNLSISAMFIMESAVMGFLGGLGGVLIGLLGGRFFNFLINTLAKRLGGESVSLFYSPLWFVILIILFAGVVGLFTGIVPARRASKIDPLDALQYK